MNRAAQIFVALLLCASSAAEVQEKHWSLRPMAAPPIPPPQITNSSWVRTSIDAFIGQRLESRGMQPSPSADRPTLLRRVYFDLIGLPPTPDDLKSFVEDSSPDALARRVDELLDRAEYGEHWAQHWLDVAHYAETHGHDQDRPRTNAWPYRDYVIGSFNNDKPYARFVQEQIAGDVLFPDDPQAIVALGFLATGPWDESSLRDIREDSIDRQIARYIDRDDIVSTVMNTFVSTTVQCARCHDHKFDPVTQKEYYALQAVFAGTDKANRYFDADPEVHRKRKELQDRLGRLDRLHRSEGSDLPRNDEQLVIWEGAVNSAETLWHPIVLNYPEGNLYDALPGELRDVLRTPAGQRSTPEQIVLARYVAIEETERTLRFLPLRHLVYAGASDFVPDGSFKPLGQPRIVNVLKRGDIHQPMEIAKPGALHCVETLCADFTAADSSSEAARRAALARWIVDPQNSLTWRSIVNRVWHYHFGRGLVDTPNDFGKMGGTPTHPELLDWLANWFVSNGGSMKKLHRLILTSAVYQQSSADNPRFSELDAENTLLWRMNRTRLEAEAVRDAILAVSGKLDKTMGGPSVQQFVMSPGIHVTPKVDYNSFDVDSSAARRRGIYRFVFRTLPDPFMDSLDCPDSAQLTPVRNNSVTVAQALAMLNDRFVVRYSEHFAERLKRERANDLRGQVSLAIALAFSREPRGHEITPFAEFARKNGLPNLCRAIFNSNEFMFVN
ncbi:MAG TPA: DUF1549 and DUF1553 domain-containing protein [Verrucomicrobiae bacterium]|jgi:hypothetical protein|nr:DUF1549 and DUF1553 domain-containing protein [Verrucomicrobiae bacterium]